MTTPTPESVKALADGLTVERQLYVMSVPIGGPIAAAEVRADVYGPDWTLGQPYWDDESELIKVVGIGQLVGGKMLTCLTPLGLAVRNHLVEVGNAG